MDRVTDWDRYYLAIAAVVAMKSKDPSTKVGAVLVRPHGRARDDLPGNRIVATGFNGFPEGMDDDPALYANREYKYKHIVHAECAAFESLGNRIPQGSTLYTSFPCCEACADRAGELGVIRIVSSGGTGTPERLAAWAESATRAQAVADRWGIEMVACDV